MRASTLAWIWIAQGIGGSTPALTKLALAGLGPFGLVVTRQLLGALVLLALARLGGRARGGGPTPPDPAWTRRDWALLLTLSFKIDVQISESPGVMYVASEPEARDHHQQSGQGDEERLAIPPSPVDYLVQHKEDVSVTIQRAWGYSPAES